MSLIKVRVARKEAAHHDNGQVYKTGEVFEMEEETFLSTVPGFFERVDALPEQIKSKEIPAGEPTPKDSPSLSKVQEPESDEVKSTKYEKKSLKLTKR